MTATFIGAFYEPFAHALKKRGVLTFTPPLVECVVIAQPAPVWIREMWLVGRDMIMYPLV